MLVQSAGTKFNFVL